MRLITKNKKKSLIFRYYIQALYSNFLQINDYQKTASKESDFK